MDPPITHALLSVSDKTGLVEFARGLVAAGIELYSSGGTRTHLAQAGIASIEIAAYTGFPEMLDGRIKTLHPKVHGGILARRDVPEHLETIAAHGIRPFGLVVVNLYPFEATVARPGVELAAAIEQIDIGGPSLIRGAAKNHDAVAVVTDPEQYAQVLDEIEATGTTTLATRRQLALAAFRRTADYDLAISSFLACQYEAPEMFPARLDLSAARRTLLRYGENPHQQAALYRLPGLQGANLVDAEFLHGRELSYNNLLDLDSALAIVRSLTEPAAVVIKHNNPCGAAVATSLAAATSAALAGDPVSAFGSVLGFNRPLDAATAECLAAPGLFVEAIVAPEFEPAALEILVTRPKWKANVRLLRSGPLEPPAASLEVRQIRGGFLVQDADTAADPESQWRIVTQAEPTPGQWADLRFAWAIVRHVKSNAIVLAQDGALWGVGAGQMSRVDSVEIAVRKCAGRAAAPVLASDAFFPFADSIDQAAAAGVTAIVQPGGSKRDAEVVAACNRHGIAMVCTGRRHFKH